MKSQVDELTRMVGMMPPELAREVLNFARFLHRKHTEEANGLSDWEDEVSRWGGNPGEFQTLHPFEEWDSVPDLPAVRKDAA